MELLARAQTFGLDQGRTLSAGLRGILQRNDGISFYKQVQYAGPPPRTLRERVISMPLFTRET